MCKVIWGVRHWCSQVLALTNHQHPLSHWEEREFSMTHSVCAISEAALNHGADMGLKTRTVVDHFLTLHPTRTLNLPDPCSFLTLHPTRTLNLPDPCSFLIPST